MLASDTSAPALQEIESTIRNLLAVIEGHQASIGSHKASIENHKASIGNHKASIESHEESIQGIQGMIESLQPTVKTSQHTIVTPVQDLQAVDADFGDFAKNPNEEADVEFSGEESHQYDETHTTRPFYPLALGELLNGRYLVEHKLGHGGFSTVWMAYDTQDKKDVALKVFSLDESAQNETRIQTEIQQHVRDQSHLVVAMDTFLLPRENSDSFHTVHVLPLMGPRVEWEVTKDISTADRMSAAYQLLKALEALHEAGIVHRDITSANCMWGMSSMSGMDRAAKYEKINRPLRLKIPYVKLWKEGELVQPAEIPVTMRTADFFLADFGLSTKPEDPSFDIVQGFPPSAYCAPERLHNQKPTSACDMWSYMVVFAQLYLEFPPIHPTARGGVLADFCTLFGPMPLEWKGLGGALGCEDEWYQGGRESTPTDALISRVAMRRPDVDQTERELFERIMRKVFVYTPEERLSATQLLEDSDFKTLMQKYGCEC